MEGFGGLSPASNDRQGIKQDFLNTLKAPYYDRMIGNSNKDFSDIVSIGEMIEAGVKQGKIEASEAKKPTLKKKKGETHMVTYQRRAYNPSYPPQPSYGYQPYNQDSRNVKHGNYQSNSRPVARFPALPPPTQVVTAQPIEQSGNNLENLKGARPQLERPQFDPILMTYTELYLKLIQGGKLVPVSIPPIRPPYPKWYNEHASCDCHSGNRGHSLEDCTALKWRVS